MSEATMERMVEENVAISIQATMSLEAFADVNALTKFNEQQKIKAAMVCSGAKSMMDLVHKHKPITIAGGDMFGRSYQNRQADNIIHMVSMGGFSHVEALKAATSNAAKVLQWSGPMNPYPNGKLGVIEEGAYADILVVNGNPLEDIYALKRNNIDVVLKDGKCHKYKLRDGSLQVVTFRVGEN
jgi:imidazolonepropionase-like amidohydrolase